MRRGGGKAKGSAFEREVCKKLSLWVSRGKREDLFWRSAMSGGRATVRNRRPKKVRGVDGTVHEIVVRQAGDITSVSPEGHEFTDAFYVECKHYKLLSLDRFLLTGTGNLAKFWRETCKHARRYEKIPMLIAKQNGLPTIVLTTEHMAGTLVVGNGFYLSLFNEMLKVEFGS